MNKIACFKVKLNWTKGLFFVFPPKGLGQRNDAWWCLMMLDDTWWHLMTLDDTWWWLIVWWWLINENYAFDHQASSFQSQEQLCNNQCPFIHLSVCHQNPQTAHNQFCNNHDSSLTYGGLKLANFKPKMELSKPEM